MRLRRNDPAPQPSTGHGEGVADKLSQVRPIVHDEEVFHGTRAVALGRGRAGRRYPVP